MLSRRIIPCLDVRDGHVVKGVRFRDHVDMGAIEALALRYRNEGADELVFYDIGASPEMRSVNVAWVQRVSDLLDIPFCVAGGIDSVERARAVLHAGADKVSVNTPALLRPPLIDELAAAFGSDGPMRDEPGYDPVELFLDPKLALPAAQVVWKLARRKLGFRTLLDVIPLDTSLLKGSHGRLTDDSSQGPCVISSQPLPDVAVDATSIKQLVLDHVFRA